MVTYLIILIALLIVFAIFSNTILANVPKLKLPITIALSIGILVMAYLSYESIMQPIRFNAEKEKRYEAVKKRLIEIRDAQFTYEEKHGKYTADWDVLINFIKNDSVPFVRINGELIEEVTPDMLAQMNLELTQEMLDEMGIDEDVDSIAKIQLNDARGIVLGLIVTEAPAGMSESEATQAGFVIMDTTMVSVYDKLFPTDLYPNGYDVDKMKYVPFVEDSVITLQAGMAAAAASEQPVFEASVLNTTMLLGLDEQLIINLDDELENLNRFLGLKVGDINQPNGGAGNWDN